MIIECLGDCYLRSSEQLSAVDAEDHYIDPVHGPIKVYKQ
jgi:hypothetical protein